MKLYSTKNKDLTADLKQAVLQGLPEDNGLYMPEEIPQLPSSFFDTIENKSLVEIGTAICKNLFQGAIPDQDIEGIIGRSMTFPAPVVDLDEHKKVLELYHGPSLAFKDFGARFMAQLMGYFNQKETKDLIILVATSGDTGGAVAAGFLKTPGIRVIILYPSGKVSKLQEKQLTTLGHNITALEVQGTFDDCQALVKKAFLDRETNQHLRLSSANSINIARLIPQSFYYFEAYKQLKDKSKPLVFCIPSGNFGNLTAGLLAQKMGLPIDHFIAATNINDVVPQYLQTGQFIPKTSVRTISNAMDVGNPSNFARMANIFTGTDERSTWNNMQSQITGYAFTDEQTEDAMRRVMDKYQYLMEPHGAVGYLALEAYQKNHPNTTGIILETAHPSKFKDDVERVLAQEIEVPERLAELADRTKKAWPMTTNFKDFKTWLLSTLP